MPAGRRAGHALTSLPSPPVAVCGQDRPSSISGRLSRDLQDSAFPGRPPSQDHLPPGLLSGRSPRGVCTTCRTPTRSCEGQCRPKPPTVIRAHATGARKARTRRSGSRVRACAREGFPPRPIEGRAQCTTSTSHEARRVSVPVNERCGGSARRLVRPTTSTSASIASAAERISVAGSPAARMGCA